MHKYFIILDLRFQNEHVILHIGKLYLFFTRTSPIPGFGNFSCVRLTTSRNFWLILVTTSFLNVDGSCLEAIKLWLYVLDIKLAFLLFHNPRSFKVLSTKKIIEWPPFNCSYINENKYRLTAFKVLLKYLALWNLQFILFVTNYQIFK